MPNYYGYICPECRGADSLRVMGSLDLASHEVGSECFEAPLREGVATAEIVVNFTSDSKARCFGCGWCGVAGDFLDEEV